jgi:hypothetical protein
MGGRIADKFGATNPTVLAWLPAVGGLAAIGPLYLALHATSFVSAVGLLGLQYLVAECWLGPGKSFPTAMPRKPPLSF